MLFRNSAVVRPSEDELLQLATLIKLAQKGNYFLRSRRCGGTYEIIRLAEKLKAPVAYSYKAKDGDPV
jgi:pyruvate dehydrogenase (quinone)